MLQSLKIRVSRLDFIEGTNLARSGSSSELSFKANISRKRKSCGLTEYQFLRVNHFVIVSLPKKNSPEKDPSQKFTDSLQQPHSRLSLLPPFGKIAVELSTTSGEHLRRIYSS